MKKYLEIVAAIIATPIAITTLIVCGTVIYTLITELLK